MIQDLRLETDHRERYITVRTITPPDRMAVILAVVEDENGHVITLQLYYQEEESVRSARDILREGTVLIVKEPYLNVMAGGDFGLRIDHPSHLMLVLKGDERIPSCWQPRLRELEVSAERLRIQGNKYFNASNYHAAIEIYSTALKSTSEEGEARTIKLNRALALLKAKNFDAALADLEPMISCAKPPEKALYRRADVLYSLQKFEECCRVLTTLRSEYPENVAAGKELSRATNRVEEQRTGKYRFYQLLQEASKIRPPHLDYATYVGSVAVRESPGRGRGLFTTKSIKAGDLLLCEKAFAHAYIPDKAEDVSDEDKDKIFLINVKRNSMILGAQEHLIQMISQKIFKSPSFAPAIFSLHHESYTSTGFRIIDGAPVIDTNARRAFISDMMIVRASRNLAPDTEIKFWYQPPKADEMGSGEREKKLEFWGFKCDCDICQDDLTTDLRALRHRKRQRQEVLEYLEAGTKANLPDIERVLVDMEKQYPQLASEVSRIQIWNLYLKLAQMCMQRGELAIAINSALKALSSLGYIIEGEKSPHKVRVPVTMKRWGLFMDGCIDCWRILQAAYLLEAPELAAQAEEYAKLSRRICVGEDQTFEETYQKFGQ